MTKPFKEEEWRHSSNMVDMFLKMGLTIGFVY